MDLLIFVIVMCLVAALVFWVIGFIPLPSPFKQVMQAVAMLIVLLIVLARTGLLRF